MYLNPTGVSCSSTAVMFGHGIDQVGGGDGLGHAIFPATAFDQVVEQQGDDVVGSEESAVGVHNSEAVSIAVGGDADVRVGGAHLFAASVEQVVVRFGSVSAEEHVTAIVDGGDIDAGLAQQSIGISARGSPEGIEDHPQIGFLDGFEVDDLSQARQVGGARFQGLRG